MRDFDEFGKAFDAMEESTHIGQMRLAQCRLVDFTMPWLEKIRSFQVFFTQGRGTTFIVQHHLILIVYLFERFLLKSLNINKKKN